MAKGISGTYNSACIARDEINEKYKSEMVYVVDSITAGFGEGMQAIHACELAKQGKDFDYIKQEAESFKHITRSEFTVDNIKYLISTGRASKALARFINLLKIKIMLKNSEESKIAFAGAVPGRKNSIKRLAKLVNEKFDYSIDQTLYLTHCDCIDETNELAEMLRESGVKNIEIQPYDLISGSHIGPNSIAVFYCCKLWRSLCLEYHKFKKPWLRSSKITKTVYVYLHHRPEAANHMLLSTFFMMPCLIVMMKENISALLRQKRINFMTI